MCTLPQPPSTTYFENPKEIYAAGETVNLVCENDVDRTSWECDVHTGNWNEGYIDCTQPIPVPTTVPIPGPPNQQSGMPF